VTALNRMPSSVIRHFDYDPATRVLTVRFVTGRKYAYYDVPEDVVTAFRAAFSKGVFFNTNIRDAYAYDELDTDADSGRRRAGW